VEGCCEYGIETSSSIKCWEVLEELHNWRQYYLSVAPLNPSMFIFYTYLKGEIEQKIFVLVPFLCIFHLFRYTLQNL
jgi:hypothetical protein